MKTVAVVRASLAQIAVRAEADKADFVGRDADVPAVEWVAVPSGPGRLTRHPDLIGSTVTHDPAALIQPLPPGEW